MTTHIHNFVFMENEIWKDVIGYEGLYQVSNLGRAKRIEQPKYIDRKGRTRGKHEQLPALTQWGQDIRLFKTIRIY